MIELIPVLLKLPSSHGRFNEVVHLICRSLRENGLDFRLLSEGRYPVVLNEDDFMGIYPHLPPIILNAQIAQFAGKEIGLLAVDFHHDRDVAMVNRLKGSENDPAECAPGTWRFEIASMLGCRQITLLGEDGNPSARVFDNFVHVPKLKEVERDTRVLNRFF